jgi:hypothetical protein
MTGNLAWAPLPAFEEVEVLDRFNGVPTLGVFGGSGERTLFWRVSGYVPQPDEYSVWLYVRLAPEDEQHLDSVAPDDLLDGLVFNSGQPRWVTVGVAHDNRLRYEFELKLPRAAQPSDLVRVVSQFAETAKPRQGQPEPSSSLPQIVAEDTHDEAIMRIWHIEGLTDEEKAGAEALIRGMRESGKEERRGA